MMAGPELEFSADWREVPASPDAPGLLVERNAALTEFGGDFSVKRELGRVGPVPCPLAYDRERQVAYRYVCESRPARRDFSEIRAYDLHSGKTFPLFTLPVHQWVIWLLEWIAPAQRGGRGRLFGLLATDLPAEQGVAIRHQLFALEPGERNLRLRPLCRDAFTPLDFNRRRRELLFAGAEGIYVVGLKGERRNSLPGTPGPGARGGAFDPSGRGRVVLGGGGLYLWDLDRGGCEQLAARGQFPCWSVDGKGIWYSESTGDLFYFDLERRRAAPVLRVAKNRHPESRFFRQIAETECGRYLAVSLSVKRLRGVSRSSPAGPAEKVFRDEYAFCVLDLKNHQFWRCDENVTRFCWL